MGIITKDNTNFTPTETHLPGEAFQHTNGVIWYFRHEKAHPNYFRTIKEFRDFEERNQLGTKAN